MPIARLAIIAASLIFIFCFVQWVTRTSLFPNLDDVSGVCDDSDGRTSVLLLPAHDFPAGARLNRESGDVIEDRRPYCSVPAESVTNQFQLERHVLKKDVKQKTLLLTSQFEYSLPALDPITFLRRPDGSVPVFPIENKFPEQTVDFHEEVGRFTDAERKSALTIEQILSRSKELENKELIVRGKVALKTGGHLRYSCTGQCCHESSGEYWAIYTEHPSNLFIQIRRAPEADTGFWKKFKCDGDQCKITCGPWIAGNEYLWKGWLRYEITPEKEKILSRVVFEHTSSSLP